MEEIKETIFLAVGLLIIAGVLFFAAVALDVRSEIAHAFNSENQSRELLQEHRKFNLYDGGNCTVTNCEDHINGDMVISLIRQYYQDTEIEIYVDNDSNGDELYVSYKESREDPDKFTLRELQNRIDTSEIYHPYLVYNGVDVKTVSSKQGENRYNKVTGVSLVRVR